MLSLSRVVVALLFLSASFGAGALGYRVGWDLSARENQPIGGELEVIVQEQVAHNVTLTEQLALDNCECHAKKGADLCICKEGPK